MPLRSSLPLALLALASLPAGPAFADPLTEAAKAAETRLGGRVGFALVERGKGLAAGYRTSERFPMMSTFKALLCGAVLARVDRGEERLDRVIRYAASDLVTYSPVTGRHVDEGLSVGALCEATITLSDNTAANLLLRTLGGPEGLTAFLRGATDRTTRLDRFETALNEALPGDPRDTTTPEAILATLDALIFGPVLSEASRARLEGWMRDDKVADALIRASLPQGWGIADKTGAGERGSRGIVAVIRPPGRAPYLAAIYLHDTTADPKARDQVLHAIGAEMIRAIGAR